MKHQPRARVPEGTLAVLCTGRGLCDLSSQTSQPRTAGWGHGVALPPVLSLGEL